MENDRDNDYPSMKPQRTSFSNIKSNTNTNTNNTPSHEKTPTKQNVNNPPRTKKTLLQTPNVNSPSDEVYLTPPTSQRDEAALYLEEELASIRDRFENGDMQAFGLQINLFIIFFFFTELENFKKKLILGTQQEKKLNDFKEIRKMQAQLSMKQVAILGELM